MQTDSSPAIMPLGPVMVDVHGLTLTETERERLLHPSVGAVILFARNYQGRQQVSELIHDIKALRSPALLIAVDQEGGRVQRFQDEFTRLPAPAYFGELWQENKHTAPMRAFESAYTMASELRAVGVECRFAPVFDVTSQPSELIGDRCIHQDPHAAVELLGAYIDGMHTAGMVAIAKHFPGHGGVGGDSHFCLPVDSRSIDEIRQHDLLPYRELIDEIQGVMTAHILYESCSTEIATYSAYWLQDILHTELGFEGIIFSDDLTMRGAVDAVTGDESSASKSWIIASAQQAIYAGCDMVLVCNKPEIADELLQGLEYEPNQTLSARLNRLSAA